MSRKKIKGEVEPAENYLPGFLLLIILAGLPTATEYGGKGFTTTAPEPTTEPSPISAE